MCLIKCFNVEIKMYNFARPVSFARGAAFLVGFAMLLIVWADDVLFGPIVHPWAICVYQYMHILI